MASRFGAFVRFHVNGFGGPAGPAGPAGTFCQAFRTSSYARENGREHSSRCAGAELPRNSRAPEARVTSLEPLEFLGDSVLGYITTKLLWNEKSGPCDDPCVLTRLREQLVCNRACAEYLHKMEVTDLVKTTQPVPSTKTLADVFEAILGAVEVEYGTQTADILVRPLLWEKRLSLTETRTDYRGKVLVIEPSARFEGFSSGPDHNPTFYSHLYTASGFYIGTGRTKKEAHQEAARQYLCEQEEQS